VKASVSKWNGFNK